MTKFGKLLAEVEETVSPVYLVGGSVRDIILGREPKDYDFCTPITPDDIEAAVKAAGRRAYATGKRFGTIGFKCAGEFIEVTTFRSERYNPGSRKPEVEFVQDLKEDLSRRDFTINAIAMKDGEYIDPYGGRLDILSQKIKAVGEATDRFKEDPLRMLRAARFASQLGFEVDPNMIGKIRKMPQTILGISRERWVQEMDKLLVGKDAWSGVSMLRNSHLLRYMLPEVQAISNGRIWVATMHEVLGSEPNPDIRWAKLLQFIGLPAVLEEKKGKVSYRGFEKVSAEMAKGIGMRLKWSNDRMEIVQETILKSKYK